MSSGCCWSSVIVCQAESTELCEPTGPINQLKENSQSVKENGDFLPLLMTLPLSSLPVSFLLP